MNRFFSAKTFVAASVALGAVAAASVAHARSDVIVSIGFNVPLGYVQPAPVHVQHRPVFVQPQTVYYDRRHERGGPFGDWDRDGVPNRFDRDSRFYDPRAARGHRGWGDADHDGVPNRFDHAPHNPYRR